MMNKNKKWFLALSVATIITANGLVMAAVTPDQQDASGGKRSVASAGKDFKHNKAHKMNNAELLTLLKIDDAAFKSELKAGKSLVTIAKEHGVAEQTLKEFMVKQMTQRIEAGVAAGKLTADQADKMKAGIDKRVSSMMKGEIRIHRGNKHGRHHFNNPAILTLLKIDQETFRSELKAGKTLVTIAEERGVSEQDLKAAMRDKMNQRIEEGLKSGKISADKAEKMKANMEQRISNMMNGNGHMSKR